MRRVTIAYTIAAIWMSGWFTGTFGLLPSLLGAVIFVSPSFFAWRMMNSKLPVKQREYVYLAALTALALFGTGMVVMKLYEYGFDRLAMFERECRAFRSRITDMPEYKNVEFSYTCRKGGRVYLHGKVGNEYWHRELIEMVTRMIRNNESGYYDGVDYPGKPTGDTRQSELPENSGAVRLTPRESPSRIDSVGPSPMPVR